MAVHLTHILIALATAFLLALFVGRVVARLHVPRVTGYLLSGLLAGPAVAKAFGVPALLDRVSLSEMQLLSDIALALMMFTIGAQFRAERLSYERVPDTAVLQREVLCSNDVNGFRRLQHFTVAGF